MKIYDCFIYFDEDLILDVRLNILNKFVDKFVIVESKFTHSGELRKPNFNIEKYKKFEKKIQYILLEKNPDELFNIDKNDSKINEKKIINANLREFFQRNAIVQGLSEARENDIIFISDVDEIPNLESIDFNKITDNPYMFKQIFCCYKFNLFSKMRWCGTRMIKKKKLLSPQWLRDIKDRNYSKWRFDTFFSKKKYNNIKFIEDGGWHFSYLKDPINVEKKLKSIRHHIEYDLNPLGVSKIDEMIKNKKLIYNYNTDQRTKNKFENNETLQVLETEKLPKYIQNNLSLFNKWLAN